MSITSSSTTIPFVFLFFFLACAPLFGQHSDSREVAGRLDSLIQVSRALTGDKQYDKALLVHTEAEKLVLDQFGAHTTWYASVLFNMGRIAHFQGNLEDALTPYRESERVFEDNAVEYHPDYARAIHNIASILDRRKQDAQAEAYYLKAIDIHERMPKPVLEDYTLCLDNLGRLYYHTFQFDKSAILHSKSLDYRKKMQGTYNEGYCKSMRYLGLTHIASGRYEEAEVCHMKCAEIYDSIKGKEDDSYLSSLVGLGHVYFSMGNYERAEACYLEIQSIAERMDRKQTERYAQALTGLGLICVAKGQYDKAESLYLESKLIAERIKSNRVSDLYNKCLNNLGNLYNKLGRYDEAAVLFQESIQYVEGIDGKEHPNYALGLQNLGRLYADMGSNDEAERYLLQAKGILERTMGEQHPLLTPILHRLAHVYFLTGRFDEIEPLIESSTQISHSKLYHAVQFLSEEDLGAYRINENATLQRMPSYLHTGHFSSRMACLAYDDALFQKGFLQTVARRLNTLAATSPEADSLSRLLKTFRHRLSDAYARPAESLSDLKTLEAKANAVESHLARTVAGYAEAMRQVKWQEVQAALKPGEAAVEFLRFRMQLPKETDTFRYAALLLLPGTDAPLYVDLCNEGDLGARIAKNALRQGDYVEHLYQGGNRGLVLGDKARSRSLYELIWQPLEPHLQGVQTVYYANAGLLHRINMGAAKVHRDTLLADCYKLVEMGSTRTLSVPDPFTSTNEQALVMGGIQYDSDTTALSLALFALDTISYATRSAVRFHQTSTRPIEYWPELEYTPLEADGTGAILKKSNMATLVLKGYDATEEAFYKSVRLGGSSPRVIHLATHGYFFEDPTESGATTGEQTFKIAEHPLIRSGLILAGGNHAWMTGEPIKPGMEDGILTAYEISQLRLSGTELVVLSACETGLGDIDGFEGVYGLQRAFKIAGVRYLIMSLWRVPDQYTQIFMKSFYMHWLESGMGIPDAFRETQSEMRKKLLPHFYWAGFVLME